MSRVAKHATLKEYPAYLQKPMVVRLLRQADRVLKAKDRGAEGRQRQRAQPPERSKERASEFEQAKVEQDRSKDLKVKDQAS